LLRKQQKTLGVYFFLPHPVCVMPVQLLWVYYLKNKKSPANAKGNAQQRCMFESPVKQNLSSPILATLFFLRLPEGARRPAANHL